MILHYGGKYEGNEDNLPHKEHHPNAVPFEEIGDIVTALRFEMLPLFFVV